MPTPSEIGRAVAEVGEFFDYLTIALLPVLLRTPLPRVRRFKQGIHELEDATSRVIAERRSAGGEDDGDLLSILLAARDVEGDGTGMTDTQVRDEALTLITAGHETTANGLNWAWYLLAQHAEVEARFHAELGRRRWAPDRRGRRGRSPAATPRRSCSRRCGSIRRPGASSGAPSPTRRSAAT